MATTEARSNVHLPRVEIKFCVRCKWNLRAAYYAQELLQTFCSPPSEITLGEVSLVPVSGGIFTITLYHTSTSSSDSSEITPSTPSRASTEPVTSNSGITRRQSSISHAGNGPMPLPLVMEEPATTTPTPSLPASSSILSSASTEVIATQIWDRKADGGFPETKDLKNRIRNLIDPSRDMGHIDRSLNKSKTVAAPAGNSGIQDSQEPPSSIKADTPADKAANGGSSAVGNNNNNSIASTGTSKATPEPSSQSQPEPQPKSTSSSNPNKNEPDSTKDKDKDQANDQANDQADERPPLERDDTHGIEDCEECRLAVQDSLEDEIGRINSRPHY